MVKDVKSLPEDGLLSMLVTVKFACLYMGYYLYKYFMHGL